MNETNENAGDNARREIELANQAGNFQQVVQAMAVSMTRISLGRVNEETVLSWGLHARMAAQKVPQLMSCTRTSVALSMLDAARCGLPFDGVHGALVPRGRECHFEPMYQGMVRSLVEEGAAKKVTGIPVYREEPFRVVQGTNPHIEHEQVFDVDRSDEAVVGAYAVFWLSNGEVQFDALSRQEIDKVRDTNGYKGNATAPWVKWYARMAAKTAVRRGQKMVPKTTARLMDIMDIHDRAVIGGQHLSALLAKGMGLTIDGERVQAQVPASMPEGSRAQRVLADLTGKAEQLDGFQAPARVPAAEEEEQPEKVPTKTAPKAEPKPKGKAKPKTKPKAASTPEPEQEQESEPKSEPKRTPHPASRAAAQQAEAKPAADVPAWAEHDGKTAAEMLAFIDGCEVPEDVDYYVKVAHEQGLPPDLLDVVEGAADAKKAEIAGADHQPDPELLELQRQIRAAHGSA